MGGVLASLAGSQLPFNPRRELVSQSALRAADCSLAAAATVLARSAPWTVAILALRSHVVEAAGARSSWSARAPPSSGRSRSTTKAGAQRRLGEHTVGDVRLAKDLLLAGLTAWRLTLSRYRARLKPRYGSLALSVTLHAVLVSEVSSVV